MPAFFKPLLFVTVCLTGAAVLIFEVTAVRALSPFFGSSIYVISSVLTVVLTALSLGYYVGGRLADRLPDVRILYLIIAFAGLLMNVLFALSLWSFPAAASFLPITYGPLVLSLGFFFLPAFLLGIDSPFAIKLLTRSGDETHNGAIVGSTFFWSTIGSIVGSLLSGFALIPLLGVKLTFVFTATLLSLFACIAYLALYPSYAPERSQVSNGWMFGLVFSSVLVAVLVLRIEPANDGPGERLHLSDGYYSQIEVREQRLSPAAVYRSLIRDTNHASAVQMGTTTFVFQYTEFARAYRHLQTATDRLLMIGGGAYTIPRTLLAEDPSLTIDVVEIEPVLYELAQQYFEVPDSSRLHNHVSDARAFLNRTEERYDVVIADVFQTGHFIPPHLSTKEFFTSIREVLSEDGVFIINLIGTVGENELTLTGSLIKTIRSVFPGLQVYNASSHEQALRNLVVIATCDDKPVLLPSDFIIDLKNGGAVPATQRVVPLEQFYLDRQSVFTDDRSLVELLVAQQIARVR